MTSSIPCAVATRDHRWVVVLAGGSGTRLAAVTGTAKGLAIPKQYCSLLGERSLLGDALLRAERIADRSRVVVVVAAQHESFWRDELRQLPKANIIVQPQNRGTAAGILLPLMTIAARDPAAQVTLLPSDHFVADEPLLARTLRAAQRAAVLAPERVLLVGIAPDGPEGDYGWILPGPGNQQVRSVLRFVEKPGPKAAAELLRQGAVWNSFLLVGSAQALLKLYARRLPSLYTAFCVDRVHENAVAAARLYEELPSTDFCRQLLEGSESSLGLCIAKACGWTDLGTPSRVASCAGSQLRGDRAVQPGSLFAAVLTASS